MNEDIEDTEPDNLAQAAINRFRDLIGHDTADNHWTTNALAAAVNSWRDRVTVCQSIRRLDELADLRHRRHCFDLAVSQWRSRVKAGASVGVRKSRAELDNFRYVQLVRRTFRAWMAYCLTCVSESADNQLADQLSRSVLVKQAFDVWRLHYNDVGVYKRLGKQAQVFLKQHLLQEAFTCWKTEFQVWHVPLTAPQIGRLSQISASCGDNQTIHSLPRVSGIISVLRFYMHRWRNVCDSQADANRVAGESVTNVYKNYLIKDAVHVWSSSIKRRHHLISSLNDMELVLRTCFRNQIISRWKHIMISQRTSIENVNRAEGHCKAKLLLNHFTSWHARVLHRRSDEYIIDRSLRKAVLHWRTVTERRAQVDSAVSFYDRHLIQTTWKLMWSLTLATHQSMQLHRQACLHHSRSSIEYVLSQWKSRVDVGRQIRHDAQHADAFACHYRVGQALDQLLAHSINLVTSQRHASIAVTFRKEMIVHMLAVHAMECRIRWQNLLKARRARYFSLLRAAFGRWKRSVERAKYIEDSYLARVAHPIFCRTKRTLLLEWYKQTQYMRTDRESQLEAIRFCSQRLLCDALSQWKDAKLMCTDHRTNDHIATLHWSSQMKIRGLQMWLLNCGRLRVHRQLHARAVAEYCSDLTRVVQHRWLSQWYEAFAQSRARNNRLMKADYHYRSVQQVRVIQSWLGITQTSLAIRCRRQDAVTQYESRLVSDAFHRWSHVFQIHVHLIRCHVAALNHRRLLMLRRCWIVWNRFHEANRAQRQREQDMRHARLHHLRIQGARQWIAMSVQLAYKQQQPSLVPGIQRLNLYDVTTRLVRARRVSMRWKRFVRRKQRSIQFRHINHNHADSRYRYDELNDTTTVPSTNEHNNASNADHYQNGQTHDSNVHSQSSSSMTLPSDESPPVVHLFRSMVRKQRPAPRIREDLLDTSSSSWSISQSTGFQRFDSRTEVESQPITSSMSSWDVNQLDLMEKRLSDLANLKYLYRDVKRQLDDMTLMQIGQISLLQSTQCDRLLETCTEYQRLILLAKRDIELWQYTGRMG